MDCIQSLLKQRDVFRRIYFQELCANFIFLLAEIASETILAKMLNAFMEKMCLSVLNELTTVVSACREQIFTMGFGDLGLGLSDNSRGKNVILNYRKAIRWEDSKKMLQVVESQEKTRNL